MIIQDVLIALNKLRGTPLDLIVTSPPYWTLKRYTSNPNEIGSTQNWEHYTDSLEDFLIYSFIALKPGKILVVNVSDLRTRLTNTHNAIMPIGAKITMLAVPVGFEYLGDIIWRKTARFGWRITPVTDFPVPQMRYNYEHILIFRKPGQSKKTSSLSRSLERKYSYGLWKVRGAQQTKKHNAQFPLEIPHRLISMFSNPGELVLDPFVGSGTTLEAALNLNRNCIGIDLDEKCLPLILERIERIKVPFSLRIDVDHRDQIKPPKQHKSELKII